MKRLGLASVLALVFAVGCNTTTEGAQGNILFTPDDCGLYLGCAITDGLAVGGATNLRISATAGATTAGVTLDVADPTVADIMAVPDQGAPTWELVGLAPGVARVLALDEFDEQVDFVEVGVQGVDGLTLDSIFGTAVGPDLTDPSYDEVWTMNADQTYAFQMRGFVGADRDDPTSEIMGRFVTITDVDAGLVQYVDTALSRLDEGHIRFNAPAGLYEVSFDTGPDAGTITVLLDVQ